MMMGSALSACMFLVSVLWFSSDRAWKHIGDFFERKRRRELKLQKLLRKLQEGRITADDVLHRGEELQTILRMNKMRKRVSLPKKTHSGRGDRVVETGNGVSTGRIRSATSGGDGRGLYLRFIREYKDQFLTFQFAGEGGKELQGPGI